MEVTSPPGDFKRARRRAALCPRLCERGRRRRQCRHPPPEVVLRSALGIVSPGDLRKEIP
jgi:hypothetical protein